MPLDARGTTECYFVVYRAAQNETVQKTLVADNAKSRPKARLSWYHPDDTVSFRLALACALSDMSYGCDVECDMLAFFVARGLGLMHLPKLSPVADGSQRLVEDGLAGRPEVLQTLHDINVFSLYDTVPSPS